jgi:hypothetical protein
MNDGTQQGDQNVTKSRILCPHEYFCVNERKTKRTQSVAPKKIM